MSLRYNAITDDISIQTADFGKVDVFQVQPMTVLLKIREYQTSIDVNSNLNAKI